MSRKEGKTIWGLSDGEGIFIFHVLIFYRQ